MSPRPPLKWAAGALALAWLAGCDNMKHQPNSRAFVPSRHFSDGMSARKPPAHTVARGQPGPATPFTTGTNADGSLATELPVPLTRELLERGRDRFTIYCAPCHGDDGHGRGIVARRGFPSPPSYHDERLRQAAVGHFFNVMTRGFGVMYPFADRLEPHDRWAVAAYIRALQRSQHATLADLPPERRRELSVR